VSLVFRVASVLRKTVTPNLFTTPMETGKSTNGTNYKNRER
jgi:hypothetical protein